MDQRILARFQRANTLECTDATESSDEMDDFYDSGNPEGGLQVKEQVAKHLH